MDLNTFLDHFDTIAEAHNGITKLKDLILDLAVQGKLETHSLADEPASLLLQKVQLNKKSLLEQGEIRQKKSPIPIEEDEIPHDLPAGWIWCRFGQIIDCYRGHNPPKLEFIEKPQEGYVRFVQITDFKTDESAVYVPIKHGLKYVYKGEIAMAAYRHIGKLSRNVEGAFNVAICKVIEIEPISRDYIERLIGSVYVKGELLAASGRAHIPSMHTEHLLSLVIPLPPLAEQKRIVEKVDELMALCDRLAAAKQTRDNLRQKLRGSAISALMNAETDEALEKSWAIVRDNWHTFSQDPKDVDDLRRSILQLAVQGNLVRHTDSFKKPLKKFLSFQNGYAFKSEWYEPQGMRLVRNQNIGHGNLRWEEVRYIDPQKAEEFKRFALREGDTVISLDRPIINTGLKIARIKAEDIPSLLLQRVARPFFKDDSLSPEYFFMWLNSPEFTRAIDPGRSNGVPHISTGALEKIEILVPLLSEQKRIVAKVDELMQMCNQLEASLHQSRQRAEALAASAISHLTI